jgi:hypothetical protein
VISQCQLGVRQPLCLVTEKPCRRRLEGIVRSYGIIPESPRRILVLQLVQVDGSIAISGQNADPALPALRYELVNIGAQYNRQVEEGTRSRADSFGVVDVHARAGEDNSIGAGSIGRAQHSSGVAGVAHLAHHRDQAGTGVEYRLKADIHEAAHGNNALGVYSVSHGRKDFVTGKPEQGSLCEVGKLRKALQARFTGKNFMHDGGTSGRGALSVQGQRLTHRLRSFCKEATAL